MADNRPIGIFDSGLGGLTVMREIVKQLPNEDIVYFGDTGRIPYGSKSEDTIKTYAKQDEAFLLSCNVKAIIAACGTVSAVASSTGKNLPVPFFEVISHAVKAAVDSTKNKRIGIIGTEATIQSGAHKKQILSLMPDALVFSQSCPLFVPLVEEGWTSADNTIVLETAHKYLDSFLLNGIDTLILGCTHYPILIDVIKKVLGNDVQLINMGKATALQVKKALAEKGALSDSANCGTHKYYVSDMTSSFEKTAKILLNEKINSNNAKQVNILAVK